MTDLRAQFEAALAKAAEYDLLASLSFDHDKRAECRALARFYHDRVDTLRDEIASVRSTHNTATER